MACDTTYFERYGEVFARSFAHHAGRSVRLDLHIFDPGDQMEAIAARLDGIPSLLFSLTSETSGLVQAGAPPNAAARGYYHAVRFIRFCQLIERAPDTTLWNIDADTIFAGPPARLFERIAGRDIALYMQPARRDFANQFSASVVGIAPTVRGRGYMRQVAGYIAWCFRNDSLPWGVDQVALYASYIHLAARGHPPEIAAVDDRVVDGSFSPDRVLWPGKRNPDEADYPAFAAARGAFSLPYRK